MSDSVNMRELLSLPTDDPQIREPKGLPDGHWIAEIIGHEFGQTSEKQTPYVRYSMGRLEPTEDVTEDLSEFDLNRVEIRTDFFITPNAIYMLRNALDSVLGKQPGRTFEERIPDMVGARVMVKLTRAKRQDGSFTGFNNVDNRTMVAAP